MKLFIPILLSLAAWNANAAEINVAAISPLAQLTQQVKESIKTQQPNRTDKTPGCKTQGAQCSFHYECCSNFCGRGQC